MKVLADIRSAEAQEGKLGAFADVGSLEEVKVGVGLSGGRATGADSVDKEVEQKLLRVSAKDAAVRHILDQACICFLIRRRAVERMNRVV